MGRDPGRTDIDSLPGSFNPRARMGRDLKGRSNANRSRVSIHAPAWGATLLCEDVPVDGIVSIHAPAWGATNDYEKGFAPYRVSIHAPAWGATPSPPKDAVCPVFQSTRPHGARLDPICVMLAMRSFQSTRPHGARQRSRWASLLSGRFNPRARMGRDMTPQQHADPMMSFNPRARMGRDSRQRSISTPQPIVSIHAPAWGATPRAL